MQAELGELERVLDAHGVHEALRALNARTPHRFTGLYRFDGPTLRNLCLFDQFNPDIEQGDDVPMKDAYCSFLQHSGQSLEFADARSGEEVQALPGNPVVSYCGVIVHDAQGTPIGSLCHYDFKPCQKRESDVPLLEAAAPVIFRAQESR